MHRIIAITTLLFFGFILSIIYLANTGRDSIFFDLVKAIPYGDKLGHILLFGILTLGINAATRFRRASIGPIKVYLGTTVVSIFVIVEELSQAFLPHRNLDIMDLMTDAIGILLFTAVSVLCSERA